MSIQSLLKTNGATFLMTSHVRSALWTLLCAHADFEDQSSLLQNRLHPQIQIPNAYPDFIIKKYVDISISYIILYLTGYRYKDAGIDYRQTSHTVNSKQSQYISQKLPFPAVIILKFPIKLSSAHGAANLPFSDVPKIKIIHTRHKKHSISLVFFLHKYRVHMVRTALKMTVYPEIKFKYRV